MSDLSLVSTTDTPAQIEAAIASRTPAAPVVPAVDPPADPPTGETPPPAAELTAEEQERAAASDAAKILAERKSAVEKRKGSIQADIDRLRYEAAEEERKVAALRAEGERLAAERAKPIDVPATAPRPVVGDFTDYDTFVEALADWKAEQKAVALRAELKAETAAAIKARDDQAKQGTQEQQWQQAQKVAADRWNAFAEKTPDFKEIVASVAGVPGYESNQDLELHLLHSDVGPELAYELAKMEPKEFSAIADLAPRAMAARLGRLEERIISRQTAAPPAGPSVSASSKLPPPPPKPVGGSGSASTKPLDQAPYEEYKRRRRAGEGQ